jgi:hypothetical protein
MSVINHNLQLAAPIFENLNPNAVNSFERNILRVTPLESGFYPDFADQRICKSSLLLDLAV